MGRKCLLFPLHPCPLTHLYMKLLVTFLQCLWCFDFVNLLKVGGVIALKTILKVDIYVFIILAYGRHEFETRVGFLVTVRPCLRMCMYVDKLQWLAFLWSVFCLLYIHIIYKLYSYSKASLVLNSTELCKSRKIFSNDIDWLFSYLGVFL